MFNHGKNWKKTEKTFLEKIGCGQVFTSWRKKYPGWLCDWWCHGRTLSTKEADLQFIFYCDYLIVQHHAGPLFRIQHNNKNVYNIRSHWRSHLIVLERRWKKLNLGGKKTEKTQYGRGKVWKKNLENSKKGVLDRFFPPSWKNIFFFSPKREHCV